MTEQEQDLLLAHVGELEQKVEDLQEKVEDLRGKLSFAQAELRTLKGEARPTQLNAAPDDYTGPRGNSGQRIMTQHEAWTMSEENAREGARARRERLGK